MYFVHPIDVLDV